MYEIFEQLLKEHGVTAYRVSKETGVTTATLTSWKQGKYTPKPEKLQKIANYFGVSLAYLMTGEETPSSSVDRIKKICKERNIPLSKLERDLGFSNGYIGKLRKGVFPYDRLAAIADYLNVSCKFLMTGTDENGLTEKDNRDITKDVENIMSKLTSGEAGPASYNGEELDPEAAELFRDELEIALKRLKIINKEKYTPKKYKK